MTIFINNWSNRRVFWVFAALVPVGVVLSLLHPIFALLAGLFCAYISYYLFNAISQFMFRKEFSPPSRALGLPEPAWTDWLLFVPWIVLFVILLFTFGKLGDCLAGTNFWKGWFQFCG
jgi:hypothetical protein